MTLRPFPGRYDRISVYELPNILRDDIETLETLPLAEIGMYYDIVPDDEEERRRIHEEELNPSERDRDRLLRRLENLYDEARDDRDFAEREAQDLEDTYRSYILNP